MCIPIPFLFGMQNYESRLDDYPSDLMCPNCHNRTVGPVKKKEFFTVWFIPLIPFFWGKQLRCTTCTWRQDIKSADLDRMGIKMMS